MAYTQTDNGLDLNFETDPEERKRKLLMMAGLISGQSNIKDLSSNLIDERLQPVQQMVDNPQQYVNQRLGMQQQPQNIGGPVAPPMPDQTDIETQRLLRQNQQTPMAPVMPQTMQPTEQPPALGAPNVVQPPTQPVQPINPEQVSEKPELPPMPQFGEGVQVAGPMTVPPAPKAPVNPAFTPTAERETEPLTPLQQQQQTIIDARNNPDPQQRMQQYAKLIADPNADPNAKMLAGKFMAEDYNKQQLKNKAEEKVTNASPNELARYLSSKDKTEEGSYIKAILYGRLGLTELANQEQQKISPTLISSSMIDPSTGERYYVDHRKDGSIYAAFNSQGKKATDEEIARLASGAVSKGAVTGQTMGFDKNGNTISHTVLANGAGVIWKNETTGETLKGAPEGYHTGKNQQEIMAIQAYQRSRQNDEAKNRANVAKGLKPEYTPDMIEERAQNERARIMGIPTTTYGGGAPNAPVPSAEPNLAAQNEPKPKVEPIKSQTAADWAIANNIPISKQGGTRTTQEQANQLAQWYQNGMKGPRPAEPGKSKHETGDAIDVPKEGRTPENLAKLKAAGFVNNVPGDPWHFERKTNIPNVPQVGVGNPSVQEIQSNNARAIANYEAPPLTGSGMNGQNAIIMAQVRQLNPNYDGAKYKIMAKTRQDFTTGKQGQSVQSMNVAVDHLDTLQEAANALKNGNLPLFNQIGNMYSKNTGSPKVTDFNALKSIVGSEVAKAVAGGATALGDREEIRAEINAANSPQQLAGVIEKYQKLMAGQVKGLKQTYESVGLKDFDDKLLPRTKKVLNSVQEPTRSKW